MYAIVAKYIVALLSYPKKKDATNNTKKITIDTAVSKVYVITLL